MQNGLNHIDSPAVFRTKLRDGTIARSPTTFVCKGYKQANLAIVPKSYAEDFENFAKGNSGAVPLLYASKAGELTAGPLGVNSDIRTDVPQYKKIVRGKVMATLDNLLDYDLSNYVVFYIGCSFSFNGILVANKILQVSKNLEKVCVYVTNVNTHASGDFNCKLVVSMRSIHKSKLTLTATLAHPLSDVHGAPVHIGNPKLIGVNNIETVDLGDGYYVMDEGHVPVFWACGLTGLQALKSAKIDLAFTHDVGHMFVTDVVQNDVKVDMSDPKAVCEAVEYNMKSSSYSLLSKATLETLESIFAIVQEDPYQREIASLVVPEDFAKSALALSHASCVAMITGFPCRNDEPPDETDGLPGVISLIAALQSLGKRVVLLVDANALTMNQNIINQMVAEGSLKKEVEVIPYYEGKTKLKDAAGDLLYDVVFSTERAGRAKDGKYYTMKGIDISSRVSAMDNLFEEAAACEDITTISIGDGGNELGMGKVLEKVRKHIPLGEKIACPVSADLLISAGVSNWGCYGLSAALYALRSCPVHERYVRKATGFPVDASAQMKNCLPSVQRERKILEVVESFGFKDGIRPEQTMSVDGMYFDNEHADVLERIMKLAKLSEV